MATARTFFQCTVRADVGSSERVVLGLQVIDLSLGGARIRSSQLWEPETRLVVLLSLPELGDATVELSAKVVWSDEDTGCMGLRFDRLEPDGREVLRAYLAARVRRTEEHVQA